MSSHPPASESPEPSRGFGPLALLVIQATPYCNLDCDYCYLPDRSNRSRLDPALLDPILDAVLTSPFVAADFTLLWHAGEPLTVPVSFYDEAADRIGKALARHGHGGDVPGDGSAALRIGQAIQTNGVLIDQAWCDAFQRNNIAVGVSIDGPAFLHDSQRRTRTGLGTHAATMRGIAHLQRNDLPFHVIAVLTEASLDHADAMFDFFVANGIGDVGFNMEETEGENRRSSLDGPGVERRYRAFLERLWELSARNPGSLRVREFETTCGLIYGEERLERTDMNAPFVIVNVDHLGNFSTFDPELLAVKTREYGDFVLGNVKRDSLASVIGSAKFQAIHSAMEAGVERCRRECDYFALCGGGAGSNKYWENGSFDCTETQACRYRVKVVADVVMAGLESSLGLRG